MKSNIPIEDYTDNVREIITRESTLDGYISFLCGCSDKDLITALEVISGHSRQEVRIKRIKKELDIRGLKPKKCKWSQEFIDRWNDMRKAAGKIPIESWEQDFSRRWNNMRRAAGKINETS